jgi:RNA polymerase sigma-54 factor
MSDQDITDILAHKGIKLARRTVAKYRGELNMDSSFGRRHG